MPTVRKFAFFFPFIKSNLYTTNPRKQERVDETLEISNIIKEVDRLLVEEKYADVYAYLNNEKLYSEPEALWRICRAIYKLSSEETLTRDIKLEMLNEASVLMDTAMAINESDANIHKWMAIIIDAKYGCIGTGQRVAHAHAVKKHLTRAAEIDPNDYSIFYMLGCWCYSMSSLSWLQRKMAYFMFNNPPESSYEEAYHYFLQAENLKPRYYIPNIYMLGKTSYYLKQRFRAKYYLAIAANLVPRNDVERKCVKEAKKMEKDLELFDLTKNAIFSDFTS